MQAFVKHTYRDLGSYDMLIQTTLTMDRGKYQCTVDLLFDWFGFDQFFNSA